MNMRCLYCGKELALLKRLTGGGEFCSDAHKQSYQDEYNRLALSRLLQAQSKPEQKAVRDTPNKSKAQPASSPPPRPEPVATSVATFMPQQPQLRVPHQTATSALAESIVDGLGFEAAPLGAPELPYPTVQDAVVAASAEFISFALRPRGPLSTTESRTSEWIPFNSAPILLACRHGGQTPRLRQVPIDLRSERALSWLELPADGNVLEFDMPEAPGNSYMAGETFEPALTHAVRLNVPGATRALPWNKGGR